MYRAVDQECLLVVDSVLSDQNSSRGRGDPISQRTPGEEK